MVSALAEEASRTQMPAIALLCIFASAHCDQRGSLARHCEERSDEAIQYFRAARMDCFASLAMTATVTTYCAATFCLP